MDRKPFRILAIAGSLRQGSSRLFDEHVNLHDESTREEIRQLVEALAHWCRRVQPEEPVITQSVTAP